MKQPPSVYQVNALGQRIRKTNSLGDTVFSYDQSGRLLAEIRATTGEDYLYPMDGLTILPTEGYVRTVADLSWRVAGTGDFDGNGRGDILWRHFISGENYLYFMNGTTISAEGFTRTVTDMNWKIAGVGDFNGDGRSDIFWRNSATGENYIYLMNGTTISGEGYVTTQADQSWQVAGIGDFDGDGKSDVLWRNSSSGENYIYFMNGTAISSSGYIRTVADLNWRIAGVGKFDDDGKSDIFWHNSSTGETYLYPMDGLTIKPTEGYIRTVSIIGWQVKGVADLDGDARADVVWRNAIIGENYLWPMDGLAIKSSEGYFRTVADLTWQMAAIRDYDGDGKADIFWRRGQDQQPSREYVYLGDIPVAVFLSGSPIPHYIHVDHINTPRLVANAAGTTVWRWDQQEPFGDTPPDENPSGLGAFEFPLRFPGQYFDKETNLHHNARRDYDSSIGRYPQADPLGVLPDRQPAGRLNHPYAYADSNPLRNVDPLGLCPCPGGVWDQEFGDFQFNVALGGYISIGNVNFICRSTPSLKCSGRQVCIGAGTPNVGVSWALGGVQFGANDSGDLSGWSGSGVFTGWNLGGQGGIFQGSLSLSGQGGGTAIGLPRGLSVSLTKCVNKDMKCNCPTCPPEGAQQ